MAIQGISVSGEQRNAFSNSACSDGGGLIPSPFANNATFKITGYDFVQYIIDGVKKDRVHLVFKTSIGDLPISLLTRPRVDFENKIHRPAGSFVAKFIEIASKPNMTNGKLAEDVVEAVKGKQIKVTSIDIICQGRTKYPASVKNFDII